MGVSLGISVIGKNSDGENYLDGSNKIEFIGRDLWATKTIEVITQLSGKPINDGYNVIYGAYLACGLKANEEYELALKIHVDSYYLVYASY